MMFMMAELCLWFYYTFLWHRNFRISMLKIANKFIRISLCQGH